MLRGAAARGTAAALRAPASSSVTTALLAQPHQATQSSSHRNVTRLTTELRGQLQENPMPTFFNFRRAAMLDKLAPRKSRKKRYVKPTLARQDLREKVDYRITKRAAQQMVEELRVKIDQSRSYKKKERQERKEARRAVAQARAEEERAKNKLTPEQEEAQQLRLVKAYEIAAEIDTPVPSIRAAVAAREAARLAEEEGVILVGKDVEDEDENEDESEAHAADDAEDEDDETQPDDDDKPRFYPPSFVMGQFLASGSRFRVLPQEDLLGLERRMESGLNPAWVQARVKAFEQQASSSSGSSSSSSSSGKSSRA